ncbi:ZIP family metal transporter [Ruminococcus difficilis]|uniref:ZIP family metal transporter n=1 Tax=Ruminococcus difficilis TaxID=2763069 RepID=A0A934WSJ4_9FIRM|nr:ZIP family metal transporter [Ruminococcus difficilis]MBK6089134.1 ZIP family metal transporter [Ruminococcus difficilis]
MINSDVIFGLMIPFWGTALGAAAVFFMKHRFGKGLSRALTGFAAGVMIAASVWSLIIPAIEQSEHMGRFSFLCAFIGFWLGILFLFLLDRVIPLLRRYLDNPKADTQSKVAQKKGTRARALMVTAVTLHNIPEGMAVGVVYAGLMTGTQNVTLGGALALALGIAIQNLPEGAIISMPLHAQGKSKPKAFLCGVLSGAVEPIFGALTLLCAALIVPAMPYLLSFAAGAMVYVVVEELIPEMTQGEHSHIGVMFFATGFTLMMSLDVALG